MADALTLPEGFEVVPDGTRSAVTSGLQRVYVGNNPPPTLPEGFEVMDKGQPTWLNAITDIPKEIYRAGADAVGHIGDLGNRSEQGPIEGLMTTGRAAMAVPELLLAPLTGTARSLIGHPMAQIEHKIGQTIAPDIAAKDDLWKMFETARGDTDLAMSALRPAGAPIKGVVPPSIKPEWMWDRSPVPRPETTGGVDQGVVSAAGRVADTTGGPVDVPFSIASDNMAAQRIGQGARNIPIVGDAIPKAQNRLVGQLDTANQSIADQYGFGTGPNVAGRIGRDLSEAGAAERATATEAARRSDEALAAAHEQAVNDANRNIAGREDTALQRARGAVGDVSPQDMGRDLISRLRTSEAAARANKEALYGRAGQADASVRMDEVSNVRSRVAMGLEDAGVVIDPLLTPAASRMLDEVQRLSGGQIPNRAGGATTMAPGDATVAGVTVQGIEQTRKRLSFLRSAASNDADRRAATNVMRQFDEWQSHAFETALLSGDEEALNAFRQARSANTAWRQRFFNDTDEASKFITKIVSGEVTPQEVANLIVGSGQVGAKGVASRLLTRLGEATQGDPEAMQAIRGGIWNVLQKTPDKIEAFLSGSGEDVANRLFTAEQRGIMRAYADTVQQGAEARQHVGEVAKTTRPQAMEVGTGPMQDLAETVLGKGGKTDEALFKTITEYAKGGSRADLQTLARLVKAIPADQKGDLLGAIVRNLGMGAEGFSPDVFASNWSGTKGFTPQAKAILFGNAGPHLKALDDIAEISLRMKQIQRRFGNPSGTAQNVNFLALGAGLIAAPLSTLATAVGGAGAAHILAAPATASSAAKWARAYSLLTTRPTVQSIAAYETASRNLANTARGIGLSVDPANFMKALQSPSRSSAEDQNQVPRPPGQ